MKIISVSKKSIYGSKLTVEIKIMQLRKEKKEPVFKNYTENFKGTLDYVWFSAAVLSLLAISKVDDEETLLDEAALPSSTRPSDHISSLVVTLLYSTEEVGRIKEIKIGQMFMSQLLTLIRLPWCLSLID